MYLHLAHPLACRESERERIERNNPNPKLPMVRYIGGTWRVGGLLALSRAFGDAYLKGEDFADFVYRSSTARQKAIGSGPLELAGAQQGRAASGCSSSSSSSRRGD